MNTLSWLLYFSDVVYSQLAYLTFLALGVPVVYLMFRFFSLLASETIRSWDEPVVKERKRKRQGEPFVHNWKFITIPMVVLFFLNLVPSKDTFYLIVASEAGEYVVKTPEAKALISDVHEVIRQQLNAMKVSK